MFTTFKEDMMHDLIGKRVEVITSETIYAGTLVEVGDTEIYLQSDMGWIPIPISKVSDVREAESS